MWNFEVNFDDTSADFVSDGLIFFAPRGRLRAPSHLGTVMRFTISAGGEGEILWSTGGNKSSFEMGEGTDLYWQHDARWLDKHHSISVFDNGGTNRGTDETSARGIVVELDYSNMKVTLDKEFLLYNSIISQSQGNVQILVNGNALIGIHFRREHDMGRAIWAAGRWLNLELSSVSLQLDRTLYRGPFHQRHHNGATEVNYWQLFGSTSEAPQNAISFQNTTRPDFETSILWDGGGDRAWFQSNFTAADGSGKQIPPADNQTVTASDPVTVGNAFVSLASIGWTEGMDEAGEEELDNSDVAVASKDWLLFCMYAVVTVWDRAMFNREVHKDTYLHVFRNVIRVFLFLSATVKAMDGATQKLVESTVHRVLHANSFSRASSNATHILSDIFARYYLVLAQTCAQYAQHAGRSSINVHDALHAIEDLGFSLEELQDYVQGEAVDMARAGYTPRMSTSTRRMEELAEMHAHLADGLKQDHDDTIPLVYAPLDPDADYSTSDSESEEEEIPAQRSEAEPMDTTHGSEREEGQPLALDPQHRVPSPRLQLPTPPSPHPHKRHKKNGWNAPDYVPSFLPPFPKPANDEDVDPLELESALPSRAQSTQPELAPTVKVENLPLPLPPPTAAMSSSTDYTELNPIPYSQSSLGSLQEWHLPSAPPDPDADPSSAVDGRPSNRSKLLGHPHFLTMKASAYVINNKRDVQLPDTTVQTSSSGVHTIPMSTQGRHAVLLTLQSALNNAPSTSMRHFDVPDTLYGAVQPDTRGSAVGRVGGGYPIPVGTIKAGGASAPMKREGSGHHGKGHNDKNKPQPPKWPITMSRSTLPPDRGVAEMSTSLEGKLDNIASDVLSPNVHRRITHLGHPLALTRANGTPAFFGPGFLAPWSSGPSKDDDKSEKQEDKERVAPDARLYTTWEYEIKKPSSSLPASINRSGAHVNGRAPRIGLPGGNSSKLGAPLGRKAKPGVPTLKLNLAGPRAGAPGKAAR
ncbi:hypothetical protein FB107DRAFT_244756 [Schizophyllum commune]